MPVGPGWANSGLTVVLHSITSSERTLASASRSQQATPNRVMANRPHCLAPSSTQKPRRDTLCKSLEVEISARLVSRAGRNVRLTVALLPALFGKALVERTKIDHNSLVGSAADLLFAVACGHFEVNSFSLDVDYLGRRAHLVAYRRGGEVFYIYCSADRAFTCVQKRSDGIERGVFHDQDHHGRRKHLRQYGVLESVGKMFGLHPQCRCSSRSQRNLPHSFVPDLYIDA